MRASSLPLLTKCTGSLVMPCTEEKSKNADDAAIWGTMAHNWVQTGEVAGRDKRSENALRKAIESSGIDRLSLWPVGGTHEGGLSLRCDGVAREASRDDTPRDGWITGHFDYQWWLWGGELWVDDLKTGRVYPNPEPGGIGHDPTIEVGANRFPQRADSEQLRFYALTLAELLGYCGPVHTSVTHWPRLPLTHRHAPPVRIFWNYSSLDLHDFWRQLEGQYRVYRNNEWAVSGQSDKQLILNPGPWCRFCPARDSCLMAEIERN